MNAQASAPIPSVLVADDDRFIREYLAAALRPHFSIAACVANGRELLEAALSTRPDAVVTDLNMPVLDGLGAMLALRDCGHEIPFVIVSADNHPADRCLQAGASAFVSKLDLASDLVPAVFAVLSGSTYFSRSVKVPGMSDGHPPTPFGLASPPLA